MDYLIKAMDLWKLSSMARGLLYSTGLTPLWILTTVSIVETPVEIPVEYVLKNVSTVLCNIVCIEKCQYCIVQYSVY